MQALSNKGAFFFLCSLNSLSSDGTSCGKIGLMKRLLVVVDYQNDFVDGSLGYEGASAFYSRILELIKAFQGAGDDIVFTRDEHRDDYLHTEEGRNLPVPHCLAGSEGEKFYRDLESLSRSYPVFVKDTFGSSELFAYLAKREYREIALVGLDLSICVFANAVIAKTAEPNAHIVVDLSAAGSGDQEAAVHAIAALKRLQVEARDFSKETKGLL
jgi:nicotinamidase/pyrazinamidase